MKKILIIDDNDTYRLVTKKVLEDDGYEVLVAEDGEVGIDIAKAEKPDLIILDMIMPKKHGISALNELQSLEETKDTPVIVWTNFTSAEPLIQDQKPAGFVVKSETSNDELISKVKEVLGDA